MLTVLKNNYFRMWTRLPLFIIMTTLMLLMIVLALYFTGQQQIKGHIAVISQDNTVLANSPYLDIDIVKEQPPISALFRQKYDAYVKYLGNQNYEITTLKNDSYKAMLLDLLEHPERNAPVLKGDRGVGVNIIGFLMMFLLMSTFLNLFTFADDREKGQLLRIVSSPLSLISYLTAQYIYCLSLLSPVYLALIVMKFLGLNIGFSLWQYAVLLVLISTLGVSFALLLNTFFHKADNANMFGNSILALTSILSGSFYSFSKDNPILEGIVSFLPQKQLLMAAQYMEKGNAPAHPLPLLYVALIAILLFAISTVKLQRHYVKKAR